MNTTTDNLLPALQRIAHLLYGINYEVWLNIYGPFEVSVDLDQLLKEHVSKDAIISESHSTSICEAQDDIMSMILYEGDSSSGPTELTNKRNELTELMGNVFKLIKIADATNVVSFGFSEGHPAYPVFWDFAYDIQSNDSRLLFIGCSSD